jgi:hypothetical protein
MNRTKPPAPDVMDLSDPKEEVQFRGVIFESVRLRGSMRPEWFSNSAFRNCVLPPDLTEAALAQGGNMVDGCVWRDEPFD